MARRRRGGSGLRLASLDELGRGAALAGDVGEDRGADPAAGC